MVLNIQVNITSILISNITSSPILNTTSSLIPKSHRKKLQHVQNQVLKIGNTDSQDLQEIHSRVHVDALKQRAATPILCLMYDQSLNTV